MSVKLSEELKAAGWPDDPERFRELLADLFSEMHPNWTVEDFLIRSSEAAQFSNVVRYRTGLKILPETLVNRTLLNMRKQGHLSLRVRRPARRRRET